MGSGSKCLGLSHAEHCPVRVECEGKGIVCQKAKAKNLGVEFLGSFGIRGYEETYQLCSALSYALPLQHDASNAEFARPVRQTKRSNHPAWSASERAESCDTGIGKTVVLPRVFAKAISYAKKARAWREGAQGQKDPARNFRRLPGAAEWLPTADDISERCPRSSVAADDGPKDREC